LVFSFDFVIGSRYIRGGDIIGWNFKRKFMSRGATLLAMPFTHVKDPMSGFFMIKRDIRVF
jgi:dolichol-phosphate mannosyltransferase